MGEIQLDWEGHDKALSNKLWEFLKEEYLVDFSVTCHGQHMKVHKFVLAFLFPMLKESLRSSGTFFPDQDDLMKDGCSDHCSKIPEAKCLNLDNIVDHSKDMDYLIQFAYTGKVTVPKEHADCLMHIADTMEINSLKESLRQWNDKKKIASKIQTNDMTTPLSRLRPRTHIKKIIDENRKMLISVTDDDDVDFHSIADDESSLDFTEAFYDCSEDTDEERNRSFKKRKINHQNRVTPKSENNRSKEKSSINSVQRQNSKENPQNVPNTDCDKEPNDETQLQATTTSTNNKTKEKKILKCDQCNFIAKYPSKLQRHLRTHARKKLENELFVCNICEDGFETETLLEKHRATNSCTELFACKYCEHKTRQKQILLQHVAAVHQVDEDGNPLEKNIKCLDCDFACYADHQLRAHKRAKHERVGKYKCKECNYAAPYVTQLVRHDREKHQNIRNYMCEECGYRFHSITHLNRHVLALHKGVKRHKCEICSAEYSDTLSFKIHMQRHEGKVEYKFVCHICGHRLRKRNRLKTHLQKKHGMELEKTTTETSQLQDGCEPNSI